jgi:hypothetical protein
MSGYNSGICDTHTSHFNVFFSFFPPYVPDQLGGGNG